MNRILIVSDSYPNPPRNGMELPIFKTVENLNKRLSFDLLVINSRIKIEEEKTRLDNQSFFKNVFVFERDEVCFIEKIFSEILLIRPYFSNIKVDVSQINFKNYDYIWISNTSMIGFIYLIKRNLYNTLITINDSNYYTYYERIKTSFNGKEKLSINKFINIFRLPFLMLNERKYLKMVSNIHLQTKLEKERTLKLGINHSKIHVISNGINENLLNVKYNPTSNKILFMSHMTEGREYQTFWFLNKVWPFVNKELKKVKLVVIGTQPNNICEIRKKHKNVIFKDYVKDLNIEYSDSVMSIIPHYQSTGFINRLSDAICAGLPVIISEKIAKTEPSFKNDIHGTIFKTKKNLIDEIISVYKNKRKREFFSKNLKKLAKEKRDWGDFAEDIYQIIK